MAGTHQFFTEFLGFKEEPFHKRHVASWLPGMAEFIAYDPKAKTYSFPLFERPKAADDEDDNEAKDPSPEDPNDPWSGPFHKVKQHIFNHWANKLLVENDDNTKLIGEQKPFFTLIKDMQTGVYSLEITEESIREIQAKAMNDGPKHTITSHLQSLYKNFIEAEIKTLLEDAFNLRDKSPKQGWGMRSGYQLREISYLGDDGERVEDMTVYFGHDHFLSHAEQLSRDMERTLMAGLDFLKASSFLSAEQQEILGDIKGNPLLRVGYADEEHKDRFSPALNMIDARLLQKAGVTIDLMGVADFHFKRDFGGSIADSSDQIFHEAGSAERMLARQFNLASLLNDGNRYKKDKEEVFEVGASANTNSHSGMTGRPVESLSAKEWGTRKAKDLSFGIRFDTALKFKHLKPEQFEELAERLSKQFIKFLHNNSVAYDRSLFKTSSEYMSISFPYEVIDSMIRRNLTFDARAIIMPYLEDPNARIARLTEVTRSIEDTIGHMVWAPFLSSSENLLAGKTGQYGEKFDISFEQEFRTTRADFPRAISIYEAEAVKIQKLLDAHGLSKEIEVNAYATRWAGGLTGHSLRLELRVFSLEGAEDLAARFAAIKAELRPILQDAATKSFMDKIYSQSMFNAYTKDTPEYNEWLRFIYMHPVKEIEAIRQGHPTKEEMDYNAYSGIWMNIGKSIAYLIDAEKDSHPQISQIARDHLAAMTKRSPLIGSLIERTRLEMQPLALEYHPALQEPEGP